MTERSELQQLRAEVRELRDEVRRLHEERSVPRGRDRATRRGVLAMAAGGALGATLATAAPAGAATGDPLKLGSVTNTTDAATGLAVSGNTAGYGFGVTDNGLNQLPPVNPALFGHAKRNNFMTGVFGYVESDEATAIIAENAGTGAYVSIGDTVGTGVDANAGLGQFAVGVGGYGRDGDGVRGVDGAAGAGVHGIADNGDANPAIWAEGRAGGGPGLKATSFTGRGIVASGKLAQLQLSPGTQKTHPKKGQTGDLFVDKTGRLWYCQVGGGTATWKQLA